MIYLVILFFLLILSFQYDIQGTKKYRNEWYLFMLLVFVLLAGLRWRIGTDTTEYLYKFYHEYPSLEDFSFEDYPVGKDPFFVILNSLVISFGGRFYIVQLIHATIVNGLIFKYIKKHSPYIFTCLFFYAVIKYLNYNTEIMRGSISIAICLFANDYLLEKKWIKGYVMLFIALMFHIQTIVMFVMPLLYFVRFNCKGMVILLIAFFVGLIASELLDDYAELLLMGDNDSIANKADYYANSETMGVGLSWKAFADIGTSIIYIVYIMIYMKKNDKDNKIIRLEPLAVFFCLFLLIQANFIIVGRYVEYYTIYVVLLYAYGMVQLAKSIKFERRLSYVRSLIVFFPVIWFACRSLVLQKTDEYTKYLPYSSVIEKSIDKNREQKYNYQGRMPARLDEY